VTIDLIEEHEPTVDNSPENYIQEINVEEVYIDKVIVKKINLRKYTKKQMTKNPEDIFINSLLEVLNIYLKKHLIIETILPHIIK